MKSNQKLKNSKNKKSIHIDKEFKKIIDQVADSQSKGGNNANNLRTGMTTHAGRSLLQEAARF